MKHIFQSETEWVSANLANQRCKAYILQDGRAFWSWRRINDAADRKLRRPNNRVR